MQRLKRRSAACLDDAEFALLMGRLGPFERRPQLAVAVSGGPDSLALCLLADRWAKPQGGAVLGLTVDHGLRADSASEARQTAAWLAARGIPHRTLVWSGDKPTSGIQAAARTARYRLLTECCRSAAILHLLVAHHADDQAETVAFRRERGSGRDGLAGMPAVREVEGLRILRPLLPEPKTRLLATLEACGQPWLDDPSNRSDAFARGRLRRGDLDVAALDRLAAVSARQRVGLDRECAAWLVEAARIDPAGFVLLSRAAFRCAPREIARRALQRALVTVGGAGYPPRLARLERLVEALRGAGELRARTLAGCRIVPRGEHLLIVREAARVGEEVDLEPGVWQRWDRRFMARLEGRDRGLALRALGQDGLRQRAGLAPLGAVRDLPAPVRPSLPSLWRRTRLLAGQPILALRFQPAQPLAGAPFGRGGAAPTYGQRDEIVASSRRELMLS